MDLDLRPHKKRRFFTEDSPSENDEVINIRTSRQPEQTSRESLQQPRAADPDTFDSQDLINVVGPVGDAVVVRLQKLYGKSLEGAINAYLDGSWTTAPANLPDEPVHPLSKRRNTPASSHAATSTTKSTVADAPKACQKDIDSTSPYHERYLGSFGVAGWTTRSGANILKSGDPVIIERSRQRPVDSGKGRVPIRKTQDVVVRFLNSEKQEVGRLEKDVAIWISALLDQDVCSFSGLCIFAPERLRISETVYLQLICSIRHKVFAKKGLIKPLDNNRETGLFEVAETEEERGLRLRQVGLVKLFSEINLQPSKINETTAKHKREGILQAAEVAEHYEQNEPTKQQDKPKENGSSPSEDENEEGAEVAQDQLDSLYKKAQTFDFNMPQAQPPDSFNMDLRKYQRQALHWMLSKEKLQTSGHRQQSMHPLWEEYEFPTKDHQGQDLPRREPECFYVNPYSGEMSLDFPVQEETCRGGVLADEMGLGKTIEMLSLIHSHGPFEKEAAASESGASANAIDALARQSLVSDGIRKAPATTLVVAPMSLLAQWASEAERASKPGIIRVLVYYGNEKGVDLQTLCSASNSSNAPHVIITSYGTVLSEFNAVARTFGGDRAKSGGLFSVEYWRIILDEAHVIKNRLSKTAKACYELAAQHRWVLTGTPIVNRLEDLFSLVRFLRVEPWSNFSFWKTFITVPFEQGDFVRALDVVQTVLEPLVLRRTKDMKTPSGEALVPLPPRTINIEKVELSEAERDVYEHIFMRAKRTFTANVEAGTLMKSYTTIFTQILRLRQSCCHPSLTRNKAIAADEEDAAAAVDVANGLADDMDLDALLTRFEADEGDQDASKYGAHVLKQIQDEMDMECPICSEEPMEEQAVTGCWHSACKKCLLDYIEHQVSKGDLPRCFNCRNPINARDVFEVIRHDDEDSTPSKAPSSSEEDLYSSTPTTLTSSKKKPHITLRRVHQLSSAKISRLLTLLKLQRKSSPSSKSVIFSQFTSFLDLLTPALNGANITLLRFDGSMSQKERARVLTEFAARDSFTVLLLSLRAGGVGLNLTCAQRVYMMDPWWSWAIEAQAIDRVHRMGQEKEVEVVRFVVEGSIEEKMLKVQERKKFIASSLGMMNAEEKKMQRIEDIRELLS